LVVEVPDFNLAVNVAQEDETRAVFAETTGRVHDVGVGGDENRSGPDGISAFLGISLFGEFE